MGWKETDAFCEHKYKPLSLSIYLAVCTCCISVWLNKQRLAHERATDPIDSDNVYTQMCRCAHSLAFVTQIEKLYDAHSIAIPLDCQLVWINNEPNNRLLFSLFLSLSIALCVSHVCGICVSFVTPYRFVFKWNTLVLCVITGLFRFAIR